MISDKSYHRIFILLVAILGSACITYIYTTKLHYPPIRSDGVGYYLYLPALFIDHDITLKETARRSFDGKIPQWAGGQWIPETDSYLNSYHIGEAIMLAPFFFIGHALAALSNAEMDGFSTPYQYSAAFGGLFYLLAGIYYLQKMLRRVFSVSTVWLTLVCMTFGTNLFHYGTLDNCFSHIFSFFLFVCFLYCVEKWYSTPALITTVWVALIAGLITLVRPTNSVIFLYFIFYGVHDIASLKQRANLFASHCKLLLLGCAVYGLTLLPQLIYWKLVINRWIIISYLGAAFNFLHPQIINVLWSVHKGLFFWSPILLLATIGLFFLHRFKPALVLPTLLFMPLNLYIISSWATWDYGGSFGHRAFTESISIFAFGYAALVESISNALLKRVLVGLSLALTLLSLSLMYKYWLGIIPFNEMTWEIFTNTFFQFTR